MVDSITRDEAMALKADGSLNPSTIIAVVYRKDALTVIMASRDSTGKPESFTIEKGLAGVLWPDGFDLSKTEGADFNFGLIKHFEFGAARGPRGQMTRVVLHNGKNILAEILTPEAVQDALKKNDITSTLVDAPYGRKRITFIAPTRPDQGRPDGRTKTGIGLRLIPGSPDKGQG